MKSEINIFYLSLFSVPPMTFLQLPISVSVSLYEAIGLYKGRRVISSQGDQGTHFRVHQLVLYCACGVLAGIVGGLLGLGGGFIMGPLFLELGVPPQVQFLTTLSIKGRNN